MGVDFTMTAVRYAAATGSGAIERGVLDAPSLEQASSLLVARGLHPFLLEPTDRNMLPRVRPAGSRELAVLFRSLASLHEAGVPVARALRATLPVLSGSLRAAAPEIDRRLREGDSLSKALGSLHGLIPAGVIGILQAGERASTLGEALQAVAVHLEQEAELRDRLRAALAYPSVLLATGLLSVGVIAFVILPRFAVLLEDLGQEVPAATRLLLGTAALLRAAGPYLPAALLAFLAGGTMLVRRPAVRLTLARVTLGLPGIGSLRHALLSARWLRAFAAMVGSGMPLLGALDAAAEAAHDPAITVRTREARAAVAQGLPVTEALGVTGVLSTAELQVVGVGEASGQLAIMARRAGDLAAARGERQLRQLVSVTEPLLILIFGGIVAFVAAALLQAVYAIRPT